ncbi:MAG TPA: putative lipid II flippase FtsW [Candidatus Latescibacteria bacterium]|nr:putative lipid II flippase FtsW [Candidatus Latescibacterota bacterium]|tara:strand:+ start:52 stop:1257 length:1206 start_codon:yes stop_codon:yes gene_type:complete
MSSVADRAARQVLFITAILVGIGVVMVYSSSSALAGTRFEDSGFFLQRQILRAGLGLMIMFALSRVPLRFWRSLARPLLLCGVALLVLVLIFGEGRSAQRWLPFRLPAMTTLTFQPSEFVKLVLVLYLADVLSRKEGEMADWKSGLVPRLVIVGLVLVLIVMQPDLGTSLAIGSVSLVMLWLGGAGTAHLAGACGFGAVVALLSVLCSPYQMQRLLTFMGEPDPQGAGFQVSQALIALGSGGLFGVGLGNSMQKHFLPEPHTDFVFAFAGEELGLFGTLSVIALFIALGVHGYRIATQAATYHGFLLASGITVMVGTYALLNVGVATGLMPTTGLPLPFISYGGSSLLWNLSGIGILAAVARDNGAEPARASALASGQRHASGSHGGTSGWMPPSAPTANR